MANRKIYTFLMLGLFMVLAVTSFGQGVGVANTATAPTIDGDVSDAAWDAATTLDVLHGELFVLHGFILCQAILA